MIRRDGWERALARAASMALVTLAACSSSSTNNGPHEADSGVDAVVGVDAPIADTSTPEDVQTTNVDSALPPADAATDGTGCSGSTPIALTVLNTASWCTVSIGQNPASEALSQTYCVAAGANTIVASPIDQNYQIGPDPWLGVDQNDGGPAPGTDNGSGSAETSTATITLGAGAGSACVSVCCAEVGIDGGGCPATNPCP